MQKMIPFVNIVCLFPFLMVLSTVFIPSGSIGVPGVGNRVEWFYLSLGLIGLVSFVSFFINQQKIKFSLVDLFVTLFFTLAVTVSYFSAGEFSYHGQVLILFFVLYFFIRFFLYQYPLNVYVLILFFIFTGLVEACWGIWQYVTYSSSSGVTGSFLSSSFLKNYLMMIFPVAFSYILRDGNLVKTRNKNSLFPLRLRFIVSLLMFSLTIVIYILIPDFFTLLTGIGSCMLVIGWYIIKTRKYQFALIPFFRTYRKEMVFLFMAVGFFVLFLLFGTMLQKEDMADRTVESYRIAGKTISNYSMGVGGGNFPEVYLKEKKTYLDTTGKKSAEYYTYCGNDYLRLCAEFGVISFGFILIAVAGAIVTGIKRKKLPALSGLVSLLILATVSCPFTFFPFVIGFVFLLALCVSKSHHITFSQDLQHCYFINFQVRAVLNKAAIGGLLFLFFSFTLFCFHKKPASYEGIRESETYKFYSGCTAPIRNIR